MTWFFRLAKPDETSPINAGRAEFVLFCFHSGSPHKRYPFVISTKFEKDNENSPMQPKFGLYVGIPEKEGVFR